MKEYQLFLWIYISILSINTLNCDPGTGTGTTSEPEENSSKNSNSTDDLELFDEEGHYLVTLISLLSLSSCVLGVTLGFCLPVIIRMSMNIHRALGKKRFGDEEMQSVYPSDPNFVVPLPPGITYRTPEGSRDRGKKKKVLPMRPKQRANFMTNYEPLKRGKGVISKQKMDELSKKHIRFIERKKRHTVECEADSNFKFRGPLLIATLAMGHTDLIEVPEDEKTKYKIKKVEFNDSALISQPIGFDVDIDETHKSFFSTLNGGTSILTASVRANSVKEYCRKKVPGVDN